MLTVQAGVFGAWQAMPGPVLFCTTPALHDLVSGFLQLVQDGQRLEVESLWQGRFCMQRARMELSPLLSASNAGYMQPCCPSPAAGGV